MWTDSVITNGGRDLLARWAAGGTLNMNRATAGTGTVSAVLLAQSTALVDEKQALQIAGRKDVEGGVQIKLQTGPMEEAGTLNQIGLWGNLDGGEDVLIAIYQDENGINVPAAAEMPDYVYAMYAVVCMSNAAEVNVTIDPNAYVTMSTLEEMLAGLEIDVDQEVIEGSKNPVSGGAVAAYVTKSVEDAALTVDSTVSPTSNNPVSGYAVATYVSEYGYTKAGVDEALAGKADSSHDQAANTITAGTLAGQVLANASATAALGTAQVRNIKASTTDLTAGTSALTTGEMYLVI